MAAKKSPAKAVVKKSSGSKKASAVTKPFTKTEILASLAEHTDLSKKQVGEVLDGLANLIERHLKKNAPGVFVMPGLLKFQVINKPATKARKGTNPFTGEETTFKAKLARNVIKVRPLKKLKDMV